MVVTNFNIFTIFKLPNVCLYLKKKECCRSIRIGKILIQSTDGESKKSSVVYAKFPNDVNSRKILLMYPIISNFSK